VADLRDPRQSMRSITDIAHGWGFSSRAHFNRLFKASMGQSPGHYREGGQAGP
jgi:AraC-like DNA-binding protein